MRAIGSQWIYNKEYRSLELDMATLMSVTPDSMRQLMRDFPFDPMTVVSLGPGAEEKGVESKQPRTQVRGGQVE